MTGRSPSGRATQAPPQAPTGLGHSVSVPDAARYILSVDANNRWSVFDTKDAIGTFDTWQEANECRCLLTPAGDKDDSGPAWTPKSGGY